MELWQYLFSHFVIAGSGENLFVIRFPHTPSKNFFSVCYAHYGFFVLCRKFFLKQLSLLFVPSFFARLIRRMLIC